MKAIRLLLLCALAWLSCACSWEDDYGYLQEGKPHAEALVADVARDWDAAPLVASADPRMLAAFPEPEMRKLAAECARAIGKVTRQHTLAYATNRETAIPGKSASYTIDIEGERGKAQILVKLQKIEGTWKTLGFWVRLPER